MVFIIHNNSIFCNYYSFPQLICRRKKKDKENDTYNNIQITEEWDKTFTKSDKVNHKKVTFHNRFGIILVGDLYEPKDKTAGKLPAIAVCGPFGAVKEQASGLYAMNLWRKGDLFQWLLILRLLEKVGVFLDI